MTKEKIIILESVSKIYDGEKDEAISDISFNVSEGEFVCLIGPSGCGKTTILKIIAGIEVQTTGKVIKPKTVAMSFKFGALFPWLTVFENVALGLRQKGMSGPSLTHQVHKYLTLMNIAELSQKFPVDLSGGQKQRVGIARALAVEPEVLLMDEPFSALDAITTAELHDDIIKIWKETKKTIVVVSHIIEEAVSLAERVILIKEGKVAEEFKINLPYPRREQETDFAHIVMKIRKVFFR